MLGYCKELQHCKGTRHPTPRYDSAKLTAHQTNKQSCSGQRRSAPDLAVRSVQQLSLRVYCVKCENFNLNCKADYSFYVITCTPSSLYLYLTLHTHQPLLRDHRRSTLLHYTTNLLISGNCLDVQV